MKLSTLVFFVILLTGIILPQQAGTIFTKSKADSIYGLPTFSIQISTDSLFEIAKQSDDILLFSLSNNQLKIADKNRNSLNQVELGDAEVFRYFSKEKLFELFLEGNEANTYIETRENNVLSITNGQFTLELGTDCPPYCR